MIGNNQRGTSRFDLIEPIDDSLITLSVRPPKQINFLCLRAFVYEANFHKCSALDCLVAVQARLTEFVLRLLNGKTDERFSYC